MAESLTISAASGETRRQRVPPLLAVGIVAATLVGAAVLERTGSQQARPSDASGVPFPCRPEARSRTDEYVNWNNPFLDGVCVPGVAAAAARVPFEPVTVASAGRPLAVLVHRRVERDRQGLALVYQHARYGRFIVVEHATSATQRAVAQLAGCPGERRTCQQPWRLTTLADGRRAVVVTGSGSNGVMWIRRGVHFQVLGPPRTFSTSEATQLANEIAARA